MKQYHLNAVEEHQLFVRAPDSASRGKEVKVVWTFDADFSADGPNTVTVLLQVSAGDAGADDPKDDPLVSLSVSHHFDSEDYEFEVTHLADPDRQSFLATLLGISLGTVRGLIYARTVSILGKRLVMPIVNPTAMLRHLVEERGWGGPE
ncbi:hypothetical protein [Neolewinella antarctica]|uniref:Preprotein translocase subunit SecB n=1 Tax=Neolewinella antarctica TaxID=442734 RepID=A0ABX0XGI4_9BACT|nr:hypothetical protein [Neolewinella antarctica]NJC27857.1 hypothetical protein [Neolewinella antarctica]